MRFTRNDCQFGSLPQCVMLHLLNRSDDNTANCTRIISWTVRRVAVKISILPKRNIAVPSVGCKIPYLPVYYHVSVWGVPWVIPIIILHYDENTSAREDRFFGLSYTNAQCDYNFTFFWKYLSFWNNENKSSNFSAVLRVKLSLVEQSWR